MSRGRARALPWGLRPGAVIQAALASYCLGAGLLKLVGPARDTWSRLGMPDPLRWGLAATQVVAGLLLLGRRHARLGAALAVLEVAVAAAFVFAGGAGGPAAAAVGLAVTAAAVAVARDPGTLPPREARPADDTRVVRIDAPVVLRDAGGTGSREEAPWRRAVLSWFEE